SLQLKVGPPKEGTDVALQPGLVRLQLQPLQPLQLRYKASPKLQLGARQPRESTTTKLDKPTGQRQTDPRLLADHVAHNRTTGPRAHGPRGPLASAPSNRHLILILPTDTTEETSRDPSPPPLPHHT